MNESYNHQIYIISYHLYISHLSKKYWAIRHWIGPLAINITCADDVEVFDKSVCKLCSKDCIMDVGEEESSYDCCNDDGYQCKYQVGVGIVAAGGPDCVSCTCLITSHDIASSFVKWLTLLSFINIYDSVH